MCILFCSVRLWLVMSLTYSFCRFVRVEKTPSGRDVITFEDKSLQSNNNKNNIIIILIEETSKSISKIKINCAYMKNVYFNCLRQEIVYFLNGTYIGNWFKNLLSLALFLPSKKTWILPFNWVQNHNFNVLFIETPLKLFFWWVL